ncbi:protein FAR1-RELATED SEQUENCE [Trifolium repens]|nr:protein FAR1-RELATED SEQUENCE [Trifolium repens]
MVVVCSNSTNGEDETSEGMENLVLSDDEELHESGDDNLDDAECSRTEGVGGCIFSETNAVDCLEDISKIDFKQLSEEDLMRYHFLDLNVAYTFYNWYASFHGFAARKSKVMRNKKREITQQTFVCYRQGVRDGKNTPTIRKRVAKPCIRCGCDAKCRVHIEANSGRWYLKLLYNVHNHPLLDDKFTAMLPAHRKMSNYDIWRMTNMREAGMKTSHIYGLFANEAGGYEKVGFRRRDMYNEQERQRLTSSTDAKAACEYLESMRLSDESMFWKHKVDNNGRLTHLFWCDGVAQRDYSIFGDVVAFDATYKRNKYMCPLVVFSGVNHHNQSIVFCGAIVCDETEDTYVWLLEQFLEAMGGKSPTSVITDGDLAMRNAIRRVFPECHHRLCAWHLIRNACTNIGKKQFVRKFKQCMLGDYDVGEFKIKWEKMVSDFGLEDNKWLKEMYQKRNMWATAHIRGKFFAGFRTTSRCEGLHAQFGRYVNYQNNLLEFLHQFFRCLNYMRYTELEADFGSVHGDAVLETPLPILERAAAELYTREVFLLFQPVLRRACTCTVVDSRQAVSYYFFTVMRYPKQNVEWQVSFCPSSLQFKCSCERLESLGIVCEHVVAVLVYLNIVMLPDCLVIKRWTKNAKDGIASYTPKKNLPIDPMSVSQYTTVVEKCKRMAVAVVKCGKPQLMRGTVELIDAQTKLLENECSDEASAYVYNRTFFEETILNPSRVRTKGCGSATMVNSQARNLSQGVNVSQGRKPQSCGICKSEGHNKTSCPVLSQQPIDSESEDDNEYAAAVEEYGNIGTVDMDV